MAPIAALLAISGCNVAQPKAQVADKEPDPPIGRYQMVGGEGGVYVLDTRDGTVAKCMTALSDETWCSKATDSKTGNGPPQWIKNATPNFPATPAPDTSGDPGG